MKLIVEPLAAEPFATFGEVLTIPELTGRAYFDRALSNLRPSARPSLSRLLPLLIMASAFFGESTSARS